MFCGSIFGFVERKIYVKVYMLFNIDIREMKKNILKFDKFDIVKKLMYVIKY